MRQVFTKAHPQIVDFFHGRAKLQLVPINRDVCDEHKRAMLRFRKRLVIYLSQDVYLAVYQPPARFRLNMT